MIIKRFVSWTGVWSCIVMMLCVEVHAPHMTKVEHPHPRQHPIQNFPRISSASWKFRPQKRRFPPKWPVFQNPDFFWVWSGILKSRPSYVRGIGSPGVISQDACKLSKQSLLGLRVAIDRRDMIWFNTERTSALLKTFYGQYSTAARSRNAFCLEATYASSCVAQIVENTRKRHTFATVTMTAID